MRSYVRLNFPANSPDFPTIPPGAQQLGANADAPRRLQGGAEALLQAQAQLEHFGVDADAADGDRGGSPSSAQDTGAPPVEQRNNAAEENRQGAHADKDLLIQNKVAGDVLEVADQGVADDLAEIFGHNVHAECHA